MIGLDTNVIVRYLTQDDPEQSRLATALIETLDEGNRGFVSLTALVEVSWVLLRAYHLDRSAVIDVLSRLLSAQDLLVESAGLAEDALVDMRDGADFSDAVIARSGRLLGCDQTVTFDRRAARYAGMNLLR